jgi:hypothetical protein
MVEGNEAYISKLLSLNEPEDGCVSRTTNIERIADSLVDCMTMNNLSAEMLLARFFDKSVLSVYSQNILKKSGKGSALQLSARIAKEWQRDVGSTLHSKRKRSEVDASNESIETSKKSHSEEKTSKEIRIEEDDWKLPLFYWKGTLERRDNKASPLLWKGSWVSGLSEDGIPSDGMYEATKDSNSFNVCGKLDMRKKDEQDSCFLDYLAGRSGEFNKGGYFLDQGDGNGPTQVKDSSHKFLFSPSVRRNEGDNDALFITASGKTEFGKFISFGYVHILEESGRSELVLARRYIDDDDSRKTFVRKLSQITTNSSPYDKNFWTQHLPRR